MADEAKLSFWDALVVVFLAYAFRACPGVLVIEGTRVIITVIVVSRSAGCRQAAPSKAGARSPERANQVTLHLAHLRPDGSQRGFQIAGEARRGGAGGNCARLKGWRSMCGSAGPAVRRN